MTQTWIGPLDLGDLPEVGSVHFLVEISKDGGYTRYELRDTPPYTNQSREPKLNGWCGSFNNVATYGKGLAKVIRVAKNGRVLVESVARDCEEAQATLDELGYPELT